MSLQTPSSLPLGSRNWKRRPPGKSNISRTIVPPALMIRRSLSSRF
ncbi:MAG TPA: hypothetical protein PK690_09200 [Emcibacteraceae bacterium]|nr:hypothetical protein [Emcibacteraceae bacterium]